MFGFDLNSRGNRGLSSEWRIKWRVARCEWRENRGGFPRFSFLVSRFSPLFFPVSLNEGAEDSAELFGFIGPFEGVVFF